MGVIEVHSGLEGGHRGFILDLWGYMEKHMGPQSFGQEVANWGYSLQ